MVPAAALAIALSAAFACAPALAADYSALPVQRAHISQVNSPYCGPRCGCPVVRYVRHNVLRMGYHSSFDPRVYQEPRYFYGAVRTYARYGRCAEY